MTLADESELWVEAHLPASSDIVLEKGAEAEVRAAGRVGVATVSQEAHTIDPVTRTRIVRLELDNPEDRFHPGMFADVYFRFKTSEPVLAVPETALMRGADGDWTVYVEEAEGEYEPWKWNWAAQLAGSVRFPAWLRANESFCGAHFLWPLRLPKAALIRTTTDSGSHYVQPSSRLGGSEPPVGSYCACSAYRHGRVSDTKTES